MDNDIEVSIELYNLKRVGFLSGIVAEIDGDDNQKIADLLATAISAAILSGWDEDVILSVLERQYGIAYEFITEHTEEEYYD